VLRLLLTLGGPLLRLIGIPALEQAFAELKAQFDRIEAEQRAIRAELAEVRKRNDAVFEGWSMMSKARNMLPHAPAAAPAPKGETLQQRARRVARHVTPDPDPTPDEDEDSEDEPPESHV
jgi:hypothetical protein